MNRILQLAFLFIFFIEGYTNPQHPQWVKDAIFYQIFPERFNNGDTSNDPDLASLSGSYPHDIQSEWFISPWTSDWYKLQPWEEKNGKGFPFNAQRRRYGGDIQGIIDKLDYLAGLGINTIYLNPVFHAPSLHKYDGATFHHVDAHFGPDPKADKKLMAEENSLDVENWPWTKADQLFLSLIEKAHRKNIRIIIDGVFNHTGLIFFAFRDVVKNGERSVYKTWYTINKWDDPATAENEFTYNGWAGVKELPELKEDSNGLVDPVKEYIFTAVKRWMDPNNDGDPSDGIDGWRLDVAEMVHHNFWKEFRSHVKLINPQAYITGEIFWDDWHAYKFMDPEPWLSGDQFDGVMNYRWAVTMCEYFIDQKNKITAGEFTTKLTGFEKSYHPETRFQLLNLMDSHDTDRLSSHIVNPDILYDKLVNLYDNPHYNVRKPNEAEWQILKLIATVQMTFPGAPMIYYGSEAGMWGADDPDERKPMVWPELEYEIEKANISLTPRPPDSVYFKKDLFNYYQKIIQIRNNEIALRQGTLKFVLTDNAQDVIAYIREFNSEKILCIVNNSRSFTEIKFKDFDNGTELKSGKKLKLGSVKVPPKECLIIKIS
jgi:glycosidase